MYGWCRLTSEEHVDDGLFTVAQLVSKAGLPLHSERQFIDGLADRIMDRYEAKRTRKHLVLRSRSPTVTSRRTRQYYRRLFDVSGVCTEDFRTIATEALAQWIEETLEGAVYTEGGITPHNSEPGYDILSIFTDNADEFRLRLIQVKTTRKNLQARCNEALDKFEKVEKGYYDAELAARLELIDRLGVCPPVVDIGELLADPERSYRVTTVHELYPTGTKIMTTYNRRILGAIRRRSVRLVKISWDEFWGELGQTIYAQLA